MKENRRKEYTEMTYEMLRTVFIAGAVLSVLMLLISVFLFLFLNVPMIIGELTGINARKGIAQIRDKAGQSIGNHQTGKLARGVKDSLAKHQSFAGNGAEKDITEKIITEELHQTGTENETALLGNMQQAETALLGNMQQDETSLLGNMQQAETSLLKNMQRDGTSLFENVQQGSDMALLKKTARGADTLSAADAAYGQSTDSDFEIEYEITYIHTDEKIDQ